MVSKVTFQIDEKGFLKNHKQLSSPNSSARDPNQDIDLIVIHAISLPPNKFGGHFVEQLFTNQLDVNADPYFQTIQDLKVSSHFYIDRHGEIIQFVSCLDKAWHAGESFWNGRNNCNDFSLGIELEGSDDTSFTEIQYSKLNLLIDCLSNRFPIKDIVGHKDIAPNRKTDPGPFFDWSKIKK
jgi:AmpD protein